MSAEPDTTPKPPSAYTGEDRYNEWIEDYLEVELTEAQREIGRSVANNENTQVVGANGFGKSWFAAALSLAFLFSNYPASVMATSGTYSKLKRTYCKPVEQLHRQGRPLPGEYKTHPPRIDIEDEPSVFFQAASPRDPGELEGVHNDYVLGVIEEADKDDVDEAILDSMESLKTDDKDRLLVISNPPEDETDITAELMSDPNWNTLQYSSFDSQPVRVELGEIDEEPIPNLVTLSRIREDWENWNGEEWPGAEKARLSGQRDDLDTRWYRRRLGVVPPDTASVNRPFTISLVKAAFGRDAEYISELPQGLALDVARGGGDSNAFVGVFGDELRVLDYWTVADHNETEADVESKVQTGWRCEFAIDAIGEGSAVADHIDNWYPEVDRYKAGATAYDPYEYKNCWTESMAMLGQFLKDGGTLHSRRLREELLAAARTLEFDEKYVSKYDAEVYTVTSKDAVKETLGRSPDLLDAAGMAVRAASDETGSARTVPSTW